MGIEIISVSTEDGKVLFKNNKFTKATFEYTLSMYDGWSDAYSLSIPTKMKIKINDFPINRKLEFKTIKKNWDTKRKKSDSDSIFGKRFKVVKFKDYEYGLKKAIEYTKERFYMEEPDLIQVAYQIISKGSNYSKLRTQVEISGRISDGLIFMGKQRRWDCCKIIGLEAKTDKDNYLRLYDQLDAYLSVCDEVYLIIENKDPPVDLPFYVGVIRLSMNEDTMIRKATSLKHNTQADCWSTLLKAFMKKCGIKKKINDPYEFFYVMENLKRKLIWNQFVIGFHQTYTKDYVEITDQEKKVLKAFYNIEAEKNEEIKEEFNQKILCEYDKK